MITPKVGNYVMTSFHDIGLFESSSISTISISDTGGLTHPLNHDEGGEDQCSKMFQGLLCR